MNEAMVASDTITRTDFDRLLGDARPRLHRYAARMTGSVIDGEDVVQNAILKALEAFASNGPIRNPESWLIRITHNAAIDLLRQRGRHEAIKSNDDPDMVIDPVTAVMDREVVAASIRTFMRLPVAQRSAVILMDVLGCKLDEISAITDMTVGAIKAALRRGRSRLRELVGETEETGSAPVCPDRLRIEAYIDRFNARDFDSIRDMLAEDVRLDLVNRLRAKGRNDVGEYLHRYSLSTDWHCALGFVESRPAIVVRDPADPVRLPVYFILLEWRESQVVAIRDFRFASYVIEGAELSLPA
jgi:RNA polymerase sigma-70 factor (ECF subfamily)